MEQSHQRNPRWRNSGLGEPEVIAILSAAQPKRPNLKSPKPKCSNTPARHQSVRKLGVRT
eukprot:5131942-Amphidinium_carterae.1